MSTNNINFISNKDKEKYILIEGRIKSVLAYLNFDHTLLGSEYLKKILTFLFVNPKCIHKLSSTIMKTLAEEENSSVLAIDKNIRWSIKKAYNTGNIKEISYFNKLNKIPTTMQVIYWLFDYFICEYIYWI